MLCDPEALQVLSKRAKEVRCYWNLTFGKNQQLFRKYPARETRFLRLIFSREKHFDCCCDWVHRRGDANLKYIYRVGKLRNNVSCNMVCKKTDCTTECLRSDYLDSIFGFARFEENLISRRSHGRLDIGFCLHASGTFRKARSTKSNNLC